MIDNILEQFEIAIHTPVKGATAKDYHFDKLKKIAIHAPAKGVSDCSGLWSTGLPLMSIHALREGRDLRASKSCYFAYPFHSMPL
ncbi:hypothetical protein QQ41_05435 [Streptococcus equi subsp. zooepidemicus]|nr:hypothetical protein QQ41_05435 [Streptococcus equi subsp. zooepidemicus]HEL0807875.1 hypothetical protein [Streptococcus equi subsp. zooepidemicus]